MESNTEAEIKEDIKSKNTEKPETIQQNNINSLNNADTQEVNPTETHIKFLIDSTSNNISTESNRNKIYAKNTQSQINNN